MRLRFFLILISLFFLVQNTLISQTIKQFSTEPDKFIKEIEKFLKATKREDCEKTAKELVGEWNTNDLIEENRAKIIEFSNAMAQKKMRAFPFFQNYFQSILNFIESGKSPEMFTGWHLTVEKVFHNLKHGRFKDFQSYLDFSKDLIKNDYLYFSRARYWGSTSSEYQFSYDSIPKIFFPALNLYGVSRRDKITLYNTSGYFYPLTFEWKGKGGMVNWVRAGLDTTDIYCTFDTYEILLNKSEFSIEPVTFYYNSLLPNPMQGKLTDKLIAEYKKGLTSYPRFDSEEKDIEINDLAKNVNFRGNISVHGIKVLGTGGKNKKAELTFFSKDDTLVIRALSDLFIIKKNKEIRSDRVEAFIYIRNDSIYHPGLMLDFNIPKNHLSLLRGKQGIPKTTFFNSYQKLEIEAEAIYWDLNTPDLVFKMIAGAATNPAFFESLNYFKKNRLRKWQGVLDTNPIHLLTRYTLDHGTRRLYTEEFLEITGLRSEDQVRRTLYMLVEEGFIYYNEKDEIITVRDKTINYVFANAERIDYDAIRIRSVHGKKNGALNLYSRELDMQGVYQVTLSDSQFVMFFPKNKELKMLNNRNMVFSGAIFAGRLDFHGEGFNFDYDAFDLGLNRVDSLIINIPSGELDKAYNPILIQLKSSIIGLTGKIRIDQPNNKSGKEDFPEYPIFESLENSHTYYNRLRTLNGVYKKTDFYFELKPFNLESLDDFIPEKLSFEGKLVSANIFEDLPERIKIREDLSLGFIHKTPPSGYPIYGGKGTFIDSIDLSNKGLLGSGVINYLTSRSKSMNITFYPDSLDAHTDSFMLSKEKISGVEFPSVNNEVVFTHWLPYEDVMYVKMKQNPFVMMDEQCTLFGDLEVRPSGLGGKGEMEWADAHLESMDIKYNFDDFLAKTALLTIKSIDPEHAAFSAPNVTAHVDFKTQIGKFVSENDRIPIKFPYNQYKTSLDKFDWDMKNQIIDFQAPGEVEKPNFISTHPEQGGLRFYGTNAKYDLAKYILEVRGVPYIITADAKIIPDESIVVIEHKAKMKTLENCIIQADTINYYHKFYDAKADITSRTNYTGSGAYDYINNSGLNQPIDFHEIKVTEVNKKELRTTAFATIQESKGFTLNPRIGFKGDVLLTSNRKHLTFSGFVKLEHFHHKIQTQWFNISNEINPDSLFMIINENTINEDSNKVSIGIHLRRDSVSLYTNFLNTKTNKSDEDIVRVEGLLKIDAMNNEFIIGEEDKIRNNALAGNYFSFNDQKGHVYAEGKINLGLNLDFVDFISSGSIRNNLNMDTYEFDLVMALDMRIPIDIMETMAYDLIELTHDMPDINYNDPAFKRAIAEFVPDKKKAARMFNELEKTDVFRKPPDLKYSFLFTKLKMKWNPESNSYMSLGPIGLGYIENKVINKKIAAFIEFGVKGKIDYFNIFIKAGMEDWYFLQYKNKILNILSTYDKFNKALSDLSIDKRKTKGSGGKMFVYQKGGSKRQKDVFLQRMNAFQEKNK